MAVCNCANEDFCNLFNGYELCLPRPCNFRKDPSHYAEVVRCKDCDFRTFNEECQEYYCDNAYGMNGPIEDNSFCSCGERRVIDHQISNL